MKTWICIICGLIYDEASGWLDDGIPAGTPWADVPDDWLCPDCGVSKADFVMQELRAKGPTARMDARAADAYDCAPQRTSSSAG